jgi:hypothetical protein
MPETPPATIGHNTREVEEGERVQLLSFISKLGQANAAVEKAKAPFDEAKKARTTIYRLAKAAGFARGHLKDYLERMGDGTRDNAQDEIRRRRHYKWLGILDQDQVDLFEGDSAPASAKDEVHWLAEGYKAGLLDQAAKPPPECPEMQVPTWMKGHDSGKKDMLAALKANAPGLQPKAKPMTAREVAAKAKEDFEADNPLDPGVIAAKAARLKKAEGFLN